MAADWDTSGFHNDRAYDQREAKPTWRRSGWLGNRNRRYGLITGLLSLAIVGAFIWSGGERAAPEAGEDLPTIHADEAPVRVPPDTPGGMDIPHQDKLVYRRLPGEAEDLRMERLLPPPEEPMPAPAREPAAGAGDKPVMPLSREMLTEENKIEPRSSGGGAAATTTGLFSPPGAGSVPRPADVPSPRSAEAFGEQPSREPARDTQALLQALPPATAPAGQGVAGDGPRRLLPPGSGAPAPATTAPPPATTTGTTTAMAVPPPANTSTSGYMIQLLAVSSVDQAQSAWSRLKGSNADLLGRLSPSYVRADFGSKGVIYRLRAGPLDGETRARALCAQLAGRNVDCMIVSPGG